MKPKWTPIRVRLGQIKAWEGNPRMSTKAQAQRIINSERTFGQPVPFLLAPEQDGKFLLYDGHQRLSAWFTVYGAEHVMDAMVADRPLTEAEHKELVVTLHTGATGSWNWETLGSWSAGDLQEWGMNADTLKAWNNDANNLKELLKSETAEPVDAEPHIDRAAELAEKWQTASGQLWKLGEHRLLIGDCTVRENVERLMGGEKAELCFTSPPYPGADMWEEEGEKLIKVGNDCLFSLLDILIPNGFLVWNTSDVPCSNDGYVPNVARDTMKALEIGFRKRGEIIWHKTMSYLPPPPFTRRPTIPNNTHESVLVFVLGDWKPRDKEGVLTSEQMAWNRDTIWKIGTESATKVLHKAPFPVELASRSITLWSREGELVYEPFGGSGTTIIAAHNLNRRCYAMEISEKYGAVILERFLTATNIEPELIE